MASSYLAGIKIVLTITAFSGQRTITPHSSQRGLTGLMELVSKVEGRSPRLLKCKPTREESFATLTNQRMELEAS